VLLAVPFSLIGAVWLLWLLDYHLSVAVWVGLIALAGLDAETGVVMLLYLKLAWRRRRRDEADRGAAVRRHRHLVPARVDGLPGDFRALEAARIPGGTGGASGSRGAGLRDGTESWPPDAASLRLLR
jgi:hypothetical protein